ESVKRAIYEYGAVNTSYHSDTKYYSSDWNSYYCPVSTNNIMGHSISIVGWDDSYSKENFTVTVSSTTGSGTVVNTKYTPENDGAWLIKNSWGQSYNSLGGYFYISYEDYYLLNSFWGPSYAIMDTATDFENKKIMQNEIYGATYGFEYLDTESISNDIISYINVFDFESDFNTLDRINFESDAIGAKYEIYYVPVKSGIPVANKNIWTSLKKGEITYSGYITVDITDIQVPAGQGAIAVTLDTTDLDTYNSLGVDEWLTSFGTKIFIPDSKKGQSFIYIDQKEDINSLSYLYGNMTDIMDIYKNTLKDNVGGTLVIKSVTEKSGESRVLGDSNGDKYLDIRDCTFIQKYLAKIVKEDEILTSLSDFNGDGSINIKDATKIQKYIVGIG
ncbi:MAG: dockerin type I domain-containing protein, partial [Acutalibacteraceae bacterium]